MNALEVRAAPSPSPRAGLRKPAGPRLLKNRARVFLATSFAVVIGWTVSAPAHAGSVELPLQVGGAYSVKVQSLKERRFATTERQLHDYSCGSAAVATLLTHHYATPVGEAAVFEAMLANGNADAIRRDGFSLLDMKRYLAELGFAADGFEAPVDRLAEAGVPAIALIAENGYHHFVVVKGLRHGRVLIGDPAGGTRSVPLDRFEASRVDSILFVIANRLELARFNSDRDWAVLPTAPLASRLDAGAASALIGQVGRIGRSDF